MRKVALIILVFIFGVSSIAYGYDPDLKIKREFYEKTGKSLIETVIELSSEIKELRYFMQTLCKHKDYDYYLDARDETIIWFFPSRVCRDCGYEEFFDEYNKIEKLAKRQAIKDAKREYKKALAETRLIDK